MADVAKRFDRGTWDAKSASLALNAAVRCIERVPPLGKIDPFFVGDAFGQEDPLHVGEGRSVKEEDGAELAVLTLRRAYDELAGVLIDLCDRPLGDGSALTTSTQDMLSSESGVRSLTSQPYIKAQESPQQFFVSPDASGAGSQTSQTDTSVQNPADVTPPQPTASPLLSSVGSQVSQTRVRKGNDFSVPYRRSDVPVTHGADTLLSPTDITIAYAAIAKTEYRSQAVCDLKGMLEKAALRGLEAGDQGWNGFNVAKFGHALQR